VAGGDALALFFSRCWWCSKEQRFLHGLVQLQEEFEVGYARIAVLGVRPYEVQAAFRAGLGARFLVLSDAERIWRHRSVSGRRRDTVHHPHRPAAFTTLSRATLAE
jgi:hypothetical protein